ncbi:type IX secretion system membrane protein PorP/SprF [Echinicola jeungdonensis]|uniref:Type IX secretion system membrane protein PorP/SprF n=1 Tax=Echinicola jeungdonensis TaxID=709343 RepID=A0ABV5J0G3_9BACT|nr:type IX secretion system membrane protein PorP/SprF [Echinicola jeungdonensis]MDN3671080.1 type IX secretion system membrane protein PorP/SprF [Echinicola jeungdonensis]
MKKLVYIFIIISMIGSGETLAQSRKYISQFNFFQSYFNPGLTGYEGSAVRGFVRNQWGGFEGAPKTMFFSAELDFAELQGRENPALMGKNAASVNLLFDNYGAFRETSLILGYASRIRLTEKHNLRMGAGINYTSVRLDGASLTVEQQNDDLLGQYMNGFSDMQILDFNLGLALSHEKYYLSYAMHQVNGGNISKGDEFLEGRPINYIVQAGYREALSNDLSVIGNFFFRKQKDLPDNIEFNLKALMKDKLYVGLGHRVDYASNIQAGFLLKNVRLGYVYEFPTNRSFHLPGNTHEFMAIFHLFRTNERKYPEEVLIW